MDSMVTPRSSPKTATLQVDHQLMCLSKLDVTGDGVQEVGELVMYRTLGEGVMFITLGEGSMVQTLGQRVIFKKKIGE